MADINAGKLSTTTVDLKQLAHDFFNPKNPSKVKFGTSGHRGKLGDGFSYKHALAIAQAVADMHKETHIDGAILVGGDTRLMSNKVSELCAGVLAANGLEVLLSDIPIPTPVFSHIIIKGDAVACLNGTASHNPPEDMGLKYNPATGGPADSSITSKIELYAGKYMEDISLVKQMPLDEAKQKGLVKVIDVMSSYVDALARVIDFAAIKAANIKTAIHPLGGASLPFYDAIIKKYELDNITIVNKEIDPTFKFIPLDHDGRVRMDPSSKYPMRPLIGLVSGGEYQFAGASDPDADRFGCATRAGGLISPNHALCVMADYLAQKAHPGEERALGRTLGTTHILDKIAANYNLALEEMSIGFKYFVDGLLKDRYVLAGEESAGASKGGWTTEKDGIFAVLLLLEIMSKKGDIAACYAALEQKYGKSHYTRIDIPTDEETKKNVQALKSVAVAHITEVAGEKVLKTRDTDGIKFYLENSWFLVRPSGTENIIKFYCETFVSEEHLQKVIAEGSAALGIKL